MMAVLAAMFAPRASAERSIPASANWTHPASTHPLGSGQYTGAAPSNAATVAATDGFLAVGLTNDNGFFRHRPAGEGDDFRVCLESLSNQGPSGVMVRDTLDANSAFLFAGTDGNGITVILFRTAQGAAVQQIPLPATGSKKWFRLVVGRDTVYAYDAEATTVGAAGPWNFLGAVKITLAGGGFQDRRSDFGGLFVAKGTATFRDLYQTEALFWSETTVTNPSGFTNSWRTDFAPTANQRPESATVYLREGAGTADITYTVNTPVAGRYRVFVHSVAGNGSPLTAQILGTPVQNPVGMSNIPAGLNSWLYLGDVNTTPGGGRSFGVKLIHPGNANSVLYADAVRAVYVQARETGQLNHPGWINTGGTRITVTGDGLGSNSIFRNSSFPAPAWNAGGHSAKVLVGDGLLRFYFFGPSKDAQAGFAPWPYLWTNDPLHIPFRFFNRDNGKTQPWGGATAPQFNYSPYNLLEIERIGTQILFRTNYELIDLSPSPSTRPLYIDSTFLEPGGYVNSANVIGHWTDPSLLTLNGQNVESNLDHALDNIPTNDPSTDSIERWVVDADPEDAIQSIFHVRMDADSDGDGLSNQQEYDLLPDRTNPTKADSDNDGLSDSEEGTYDTKPWNPDTDGDGLKDGVEVHSGLDFDPRDGDSDNDGVGDFTEWEIITFLADDDFNGQEDITADPDSDFDHDEVSDLHESEDRTSAVNPEDWFSPVKFERLFGQHFGVTYSEDATASGILSTRLERTAPTGPAGGISHHEAKDGTRLRFQFEPGADTDRIRIGFARRTPVTVPVGARSRVELRFAPVVNAAAEVLFDGTPAAGVAPFTVSPDDLLELRLDFTAVPPVLHVEKLAAGSQTAVVSPIVLPIGLTTPDVPGNPLAIAVDLAGSGAQIHNARYRRVHDPDRDDDRMPDVWEDLHELNPLNPLDAADDVEPDGLTNLEEYELGTDPNDPDTDGDQMEDGWEVEYGLDPKDDADGAPTADKDQDGLSNRIEHDFGTRPDTKFTAGDAFSDAWRHRYGLHPTNLLDGSSDADQDGLTLAQEFTHGTDPDEADTDNDGVDDGDEVTRGEDPLERPIPMPTVVLQGRSHITQGAGGSFAGYYGGTDDQVIIETRYRRFRIMLFRDLLDFENVKIGEELFDLIAPAAEFDTEFQNMLNAGWRKVNENEAPRGLEPYQHTEIIYGTPPTWQDAQGSPYWAEGPTLPNYTAGQVALIAGEEAITPLYEEEDRFFNGSLSPMGFPGGWTPVHRIAYGRLPHIGAPATANHAKFLTGIVPEARWSEYWIQADGTVPRLKPVSRTVLLLATERDATGAIGLVESGRVTFTIPGTGEISEGAPVVEGLVDAAAWVEPTAGGTLVVKPPAERGADRRVDLIEFRAKQGRMIEGFDPILDPEDDSPWASVTGGKVADHVEFACPGAAGLPVVFEVITGQTALSVLPAQASGDVTAMTLTGGAIAEPTEAVIAAKVNGTEIAKLRVLVLPERELEFSIYRVSDASSPADTTPPADAPADAAVEATLNEVYGQAGIRWILTGSEAVSVNYDKPVGEGDKMLSVAERSNLLTVLNASDPEGRWGGEKVFKALIVRNFAPGTHAVAFHVGTGNELSPGGLAASTYSIPKLVIAHEFGHVLGLAAKPGQDAAHDFGPWPTGLESLMRPGPGTIGKDVNPGKWLRHEDWRLANESAVAFEN